MARTPKNQDNQEAKETKVKEMSDEQKEQLRELNEQVANQAINNRYDFMLLFDVENGNPNGDPDLGNAPRLDPETGIGLVTDICIKRKVRNYVETVKDSDPHYNIYVKQGIALETQQRKAYNEYNLPVNDKKKTGNQLYDRQLTMFMCDNFFDIRTFGAVMTTTANCGQVRGPVQMNFAKSIDRIVPQEITITRVTVTKESDLSKPAEMGKKQIVPYGLYRIEGYISANIAKQTGFSEEDLALFWEALINMFEIDHAAARGKMCSRDLFVFKHDSELGNCPAHKLFDLIKVEKKDKNSIPRSYKDYEITVDEQAIPQNVEYIKKL